MPDNKIKRLAYLGGIYAILYFIIGMIGLFSLLFDSFLIGFKDPIEQLLLLLIAIIYLRGFLRLKDKKRTGIAFIFVAAIMGIILGALSSLNLIVNGFLGSLFEEYSLTVAFNRVVNSFSLTIVIGILSLIPFRFVQSIEYTLVEF